VWNGRFHGILPKEYSGTFYEVPWGLYGEIITIKPGCHSTQGFNKWLPNGIT